MEPPTQPIKKRKEQPSQIINVGKAINCNIAAEEKLEEAVVIIMASDEDTYGGPKKILIPLSSLNGDQLKLVQEPYLDSTDKEEYKGADAFYKNLWNFVEEQDNLEDEPMPPGIRGLKGITEFKNLVPPQYRVKHVHYYRAVFQWGDEGKEEEESD